MSTNELRYVHGNWTHLFGPGKGVETMTQVVYDRHEERVVALLVADRLSFGRLRNASRAEIADVEDSLKNANPEAIDEPINFGLHESEDLPGWAEDLVASPTPERPRA